ncbi:MAG: pentapeptide repeat-containing protein [Pirellulaceae bacterium]
MISPRRAPVRPRVVLSETHETVLLEDFVDSLDGQGHHGPVELLGGPRTGKTTALAHLASLPVADRLMLVDDAGPADVPCGMSNRLVVYSTRYRLRHCELRCELVPWCDDDLIEYLLSTHPDRCSFVMARFMADRNRALLNGKPELYCTIAEQLAASGLIDDIRTALRRGVAARMQDEQTLQDARFYTMAVLLGEQTLADGRARQMLQRGISREVLGLLSYPWVQILLAADRIVSRLKGDSAPPFPRHQWPRGLVVEVAQLAERDPAVLIRLQDIADGGEADYVPMAASVLHLADPDWRPNRNCCSDLTGAYLPVARWEGIDLSQVNLERADLRRANLRGANLAQARLSRAILRRSDLAEACLTEAWAHRADFSGADLTRADMTRGRFAAARFTKSLLNHVLASDADFRRADLRGASSRAANFSRCDFRHASLDGADFQDANLQGANLSDQVLSRAILLGADLSGSNLSRCDLEFLELPGAHFKDANFMNAWLTGSVMHGGDFRHARLVHAGLADIDWERVDLRGADLRGCSFHLGSSRSGLVGSPYPCHGSRTGFYTNDYDDQSYKAPEAIRKANLCGADLRGASIADVDFYLVDLRGARYDPEQAEHFRQCDAILVDRTA